MSRTHRTVAERVCPVVGGPPRARRHRLHRQHAAAAPTTTPTPRRTITFWHGWSAPSEVKAIQDNVDAFEKANPNIHVKVVGNITDDKINQALRAGGYNAPDVVSSFTTDNVGKFCSSDVFVDLTPFLEKDGIDPETTFPAAMLDYTQFEGQPVHASRCSVTRTASTTTRTRSRQPASPSRRRPCRSSRPTRSS